MSHHQRQRQQRQDVIRNIAVSWYWRLQDSDVSPEERRQFQLWIAVEEHRKAFDSAATAWEHACQASLAGPDNGAAPPSTQHRLTKVAMRAAVVLLLLMAFGSPPGTAAWILEAGNTPAAHRLMDGSFVRVAPSTRLEISFDERERSTYLPRGQAFFHVSKDAARPFTVTTPAATVRATGTRFGVTYQHQVSVITVAEGSVIVTRARHDTSNPAMQWSLGAGQRLQVSIPGTSPGSHIEADVSLDWATAITFERDPPAVAVERFNRLSDVRLELSHPNIGGTPITGTYQLDDPEGFASKLAKETSAPVRLYERAASGREAKPRVVQPPNQNRNREAAP